MQVIGKESAAPETKGADRDKGGNGWLRSHWCVLALAIIVIVAFVLRFAMSYGVSADGDYALSGGSSAQYHLHVIESILAGSWSLTDMSVNYPVGGSLAVPPLLDFIAAGVASLFQGSMGTTEAASFALAVLAPIFGALTCIPVYLIGKEMFDKTIGVIAALIFAFLALPISTTVFSNGTEYGLAAFLVAFMSYFAVRMVKAADREDSRKSVYVNALLAGIFLMLAALTWNGFRYIVVLLAVAMVLQAVSSRLRGKDFKDVTLGYCIVLLVGTLIPAAYYVPAGLMDAVYSGPLLIAVVSVVFTLVFLALRSKPWVVTLPVLVIVFLVICAAMAVGDYDLFSDFIFGNTVYTGTMEDLVSTRVSMSNVAAYYGWLTMWLPICLALYETYVYFRRDRSNLQLFTVVWLYVMFFTVWTNYANAAVVGCVFGVGAAAAIVKVFRSAKVRDWVHNIRGGGFRASVKKFFKPYPLASVLIVILLVVIPNASFAVDAGQPTNTEGDHYYTGNTSFTVATGDSYPLEDIWETYEDEPKDGAIVTWIDDAYAAVSQAGFETVTDGYGNGAEAVSSIYLADGSAGAVAGMMMRLLLSDPDTDYSSCFGDDADVYDVIAGYIDDPSLAKEAITSDPDTFGNVRSDISDETAVYLASIQLLLTEMNEKEIMDAYDAVCDASGNSISYILVDGSMLPLQYGDGSLFSTIAYLAGYSVDSYGAATEYYSYNIYYGTTTYTDEIYDTLIWRALVGPSASEAGYSSSYSYLVALALSDGTVKAIPGYGLVGFEVSSWIVMYNEDDEATLSDDGWVYMDGWEAMALQEEQGGLIDYLAGYVMLTYTGSPSGSSILEGTVQSDDGTAVDGATVSVYQYSELYEGYVLYSETVTRDGAYEAVVPDGDYRVDIKIGDLVVESFSSSAAALSVDTVIESAVVEGEVTVNGETYDGEAMMLYIESDAMSASFEIGDGTFTISGVLPGTYSYILYGEDGSSLGTGSVTIYPGESVGLEITPTTRTITVTVEDVFGNEIDGTSYDEAPIVVATSTTTGAQFYAEVGEDGEAVIYVVSGRYTLSLGNGLVSMTSTTQNASSSNRTATVTAYESQTVEVLGAPGTVLSVSGGEFSTVTYELDGNVYFDVPVGLGTDEMQYSVYGVSGSEVYYGTYTGGDSVELSSGDYVTVTGTLTDPDGDATDGTVEFISGDFSVAAVTDDDGNFTVYLPSGLEFTIYAYTSDDDVYLGTRTISADEDLGELETVDGKEVRATLRYDTGTSDGNETLPFVKAIVQFTYDDVDYEFVTMTNTSGRAYFYVPDDVDTCTVSFNNTAGTLENAYFTCTGLTNEVSGTTSTTTIQYVGYTDDQENTVRQIEYTAPFDMTLVFYEEDEDEIVLEAGETYPLCPGQYDIVVDGSTGYYFDGTAYLYPGAADFTGFDYVEVVTVYIDRDESDSLSIESEGEYFSFSDGYYFEVGYVYYLTSEGSYTTTVESDDDDEEDETVTTYTIAYGYLDLTGASAEDSYTIDMTAEADVMEVTGYVGISADGTIEIEYLDADGNRVVVQFEIDNGAYTLTLPADVGTVTATAEVTTTVDGETYTFAASGDFSDMTEGSIRNLAVVNSDPEEDGEEEEEPELEAEIVSAYFADGRATVEFAITNNTDSDMTYLVTSGDSWSLDVACSVTVPANSTVTATVTGYYDASLVAPGLDGVDLTVEDINGDNSVTVDIVDNGAPAVGDEGAEILLAGEDGASNDVLSPSQYRYAITLVNDDVYSKTVTIDVGDVPDGWYVTIMDADGAYVGEPGGSFTIHGLETATYYVALMQISAEEGDSVEVPSLTATVTIDGDSTDVELEPAEIEVSVDDAYVSGTDALDERSGTPAGIWFLVAVIILMVIAILWLASRRGVFGRK